MVKSHNGIGGVLKSFCMSAGRFLTERTAGTSNSEKHVSAVLEDVFISELFLEETVMKRVVFVCICSTT